MDDLCFECDKPAHHNHHVVPRSVGGTRTIPLCETCHEKVHGFKTGFYALSRAARVAHHERAAANRVSHAAITAADKATKGKEDARKFALMQELRNKGMTLRAIANQLNEMGETTRTGKKWKHATIDAILKKIDGNKTHQKGAIKAKAERDEFRSKVCPVIQGMRNQGMTLREITAQLNALGIRTILGGKWTHSHLPKYLRPEKPAGHLKRHSSLFRNIRLM